jgi:hypothetical protein
MRDPTSQLRSATTRAKSDVANKLVSMFLHELSRRICRSWRIRVDTEEYEQLVRLRFDNRCPYCNCDLRSVPAIIEHLDGMNRYRAGLHIPGNVFVACRKCNSEKRRDDSRPTLNLAGSGWESFLSHDGARCEPRCKTCRYWAGIWEHEAERRVKLAENLEAIRAFRREFPSLIETLPSLSEQLPSLLNKLYVDCQIFAQREMTALLEAFWKENEEQAAR